MGLGLSTCSSCFTWATQVGMGMCRAREIHQAADRHCHCVHGGGVARSPPHTFTHAHTNTHTDVLPVGDLGVRAGMAQLYSLKVWRCTHGQQAGKCTLA